MIKTTNDGKGGRQSWEVRPDGDDLVRSTGVDFFGTFDVVAWGETEADAVANFHKALKSLSLAADRFASRVSGLITGT